MHRIVATDCTDPFANLALEEYLFESPFEGVTFFLWQNRRTVVIGRSQNAYRECRVEELERAGGRLARRASGGGAVYHDLGNLNFTFCCPEPLFDLTRQLSVLMKAVSSFGLTATFSGRNDLLAEGRKFSGNAFRHARGRAMHHGTLLVNENMEELSRFLNVDPEKMASKGVKSVRARVVNLADLCPALTVQALKKALIRAFEEEYGESRSFTEADFWGPELDLKTKIYASWAWRMGENPPFDLRLSRRFDFGNLEILLNIEGSVIRDARVYSDMLDPDFPAALAGRLKGCPFTSEALRKTVEGLNPPEIAAAAARFLAKSLQDPPCLPDPREELAHSAQREDV